MSWAACAISDALFCESLYFTLVRYIILQNCVFENNYYVCVHPRFDPISIKMCLVKKSRDTDTSTRRSEVYRSATQRCDSYLRNILIWKRDNDGRRKILTLQQRVDVLKLLDAGHSFRAVQCRYRGRHRSVELSPSHSYLQRQRDDEDRVIATQHNLSCRVRACVCM